MKEAGTDIFCFAFLYFPPLSPFMFLVCFLFLCFVLFLFIHPVLLFILFFFCLYFFFSFLFLHYPLTMTTNYTIQALLSLLCSSCLKES